MEIMKTLVIILILVLIFFYMMLFKTSENSDEIISKMLGNTNKRDKK
jgi:uncharacterized membrane protein